MKTRFLLAALLSLSAGAAEDEPHLLAPWIVAEAPLRPAEPPRRATALLPSEAWSGRAVGTFADALRQTPGAILQESFGGFEPPRLSIRGSGLQSAPSSRGVTLLLNQLPLGLADGSFNSALFDPLFAERIEVQCGLDGWRTSPSVTGGALDFRRNGFGANTVGLRAESGSFGATRVRGFGAVAGRRTHATAAFSFAEQDGYREHSGQNRAAFFGALEHTFAADTRLGFEAYQARAHYDVPGPLPLAAALATPGSVSADVLRDRPDRSSELARVAGSIRHVTAEHEFDLRAAFSRTSDDFRQLRANGVTLSRSDDLFAAATYARRFRLAEAPHRFSATVTAARGWRDQQRFRNDSGQTGPRFARDTLRPTTTTLQLEDMFALAPSLTATLGFAHVEATRDVIDLRRLKSADTLPAAALHWQFAPQHVAFASISAAAEPPTFDDLLVTAGPYPAQTRVVQSLATQRARTSEVGVRGRAGPISWDAALYRSSWHNEILRLADANGNARGAVNASPTTHDGLETSLRWRLREEPVRISLAATAVWTRFVFEADPVYGANRLAGIPPHFGAAELTVDLPWGGFFAAGADWTAGHTRVDHAGKLRYGGQALAHVRAGWRNAPYWTCFVEVRNAFDRRTIASTAGVLDLARNPASTSIFLPAPGRSFVIGIEWKL